MKFEYQVKNHVTDAQRGGIEEETPGRIKVSQDGVRNDIDPTSPHEFH